ncbi:MAG: ArnT family glycosyltransferase [Anaerolineae bacterium]
MKSVESERIGVKKICLASARRNIWLEWGLIVTIALLVRLSVNAWVLGFNYIPDPDTTVYENTAMNVMQGRGYVAPEGRSYTAPLYPLFLAGLYTIFGLQNYPALKAIESLIGALTCGWVYLIGRTLFGRSTGRLAGLLSTIYPFLIYYTGTALTENLFTFLLAAGMVCLAALVQGFRWQYVLGGGVLLGLATLTRPVALGLSVVVPIWAGLVFSDSRRALLSAAGISLALILTVLPWSIRNYVIHHQVILIATEDGVTFWGSNNPIVADNPAKAGRWMLYTQLPHAAELVGLPELELRRRTYELGWEFLRHNLDKIPRLEAYKLLRFWSLYPNRSALEKALSLLSYGILFPFMLIGAIWSLRRNWCGSLLLWGVIALFTGSALIFYGSTRMRFPIEPYLLIFAAFALDRIFSTKVALVRRRLFGDIFMYKKRLS